MASVGSSPPVVYTVWCNIDFETVVFLNKTKRTGYEMVETKPTTGNFPKQVVH